MLAVVCLLCPFTVLMECMSWFVFFLSCCSIFLSLQPLFFLVIIKDPTPEYQSLFQLFLSLSLSLSVSLSRLLSLKLSGCMSGRMSTIDLYRQHFSNDGGLWVAPSRIQQTGDQVSDELAGRWEEEAK